MKNENQIPVNRTFKSTLFAMLFGEKENLLELYNAMSGRHYDNPELLEINTLENAIYMSIQNDVSFIIDDRLSLYEHQSTYSPNLPLRFLFYISNLYSGMTKDNNLYGTRKVRLPFPEFVIFYNGEEERPDREVLRLSDLYTTKENYGLELKAVLLNIKGGHNEELKKACRTLREYAVFTDKMRKYARYKNIEKAAERTIEECIREGILKDYLMKHRAEVKSLSIFEYDQEKHLRMEREEAWEEGRIAGLTELIKKKLAKGLTVPQIAELLEEKESVIEDLIERYHL